MLGARKTKGFQAITEHMLLQNCGEHRLTLDKNIKLLSGHYYRLYFRKAVGLDSGDIDCSSMDLLGYEELPAVTEAV